MKKNLKNKKSLNIAMLGHKRIPSREGGIEIVVEELASILWYSIKAAFLFSLTIEFLQLFLRLGTFQLSDLCYNTLGGAIGGVLYWMGWKVKNRDKG